jgi:hypothetical protein
MKEKKQPLDGDNGIGSNNKLYASTELQSGAVLDFCLTQMHPAVCGALPTLDASTDSTRKGALLWKAGH